MSSHPDDPDASISPSTRRHPPRDLYLSLTDIADLSQQSPASPRHQRIHTTDNARPESPIRLTSARFAGGYPRPGSVNSPLRSTFAPQPPQLHEQASHHLNPTFAVRDLDQYAALHSRSAEQMSP